MVADFSMISMISWYHEGAWLLATCDPRGLAKKRVYSFLIHDALDATLDTAFDHDIYAGEIGG